MSEAKKECIPMIESDLEPHEKLHRNVLNMINVEGQLERLANRILGKEDGEVKGCDNDCLGKVSLSQVIHEDGKMLGELHTRMMNNINAIEQILF